MERKNRSGIMMPGVILIMIGLWLLLQRLNVTILAVDEAWPALLVLIGALLIANFALTRGRATGSIFVGVVLALVGLVFANVMWGSWEWEDLWWLWPVFPGIVGVAFLAHFLVRPTDWGVLIPGLMDLAVGIIGYLYTTQRVSARAAWKLVELWPVLIIVVGVGLMSQYLERKKSDDHWD